MCIIQYKSSCIHYLWTHSILTWEKNNYVRRESDKPRCINPLSVACKFDVEKQITKKRVCMDLSRNVNNFISDTPVKLSDLEALSAYSILAIIRR